VGFGSASRRPQGGGCHAEVAKRHRRTSETAMTFVHILQSIAFPDRFYAGVTTNVSERLAKHNAGEVHHTSKYGPWRLKTYIAFSDKAQAHAFEKYLKSGSGRAFAKKRL
jgi:predicted GIY-YIG superfamily endonuclease